MVVILDVARRAHELLEAVLFEKLSRRVFVGEEVRLVLKKTEDEIISQFTFTTLSEQTEVIAVLQSNRAGTALFVYQSMDKILDRDQIDPMISETARRCDTDIALASIRTQCGFVE